MSFTDWHKELISDYQWYSLLRMYKDETIKKAAEKVFAQLVADKVVELRPMSENRKHVYNIVTKNPMTYTSTGKTSAYSVIISIT